MSLKIEVVHLDQKAGTHIGGLFDGEPFRIVAEGGRWLFKTAKGWTHTEDLFRADSLAEARNFAYSAVAQFRRQHRLA